MESASLCHGPGSRSLARVSVVLAAVACICGAGQARSKEPRTKPGWSVESDRNRAQLIELYSSQGCSSCPPAEAWLSRLLDDEDLWRRRVPVNFHVDYWDRLGWPDAYASSEHTERQYAYARALDLPSAYTPGFVLDGAEWRGFFSGAAPPAPAQTPSPLLSARIEGERLQLRFEPLPRDASNDVEPSGIDFHVALLGIGLCNEIGAGENRGRLLRQDFIVLAHERVPAQRADDGFFGAELAVPQSPSARPERYALALWATPTGKLAPLQATGGWLEESFAPTSDPRGGADESRVSCP